jgi:hypothetical protein
VRVCRHAEGTPGEADKAWSARRRDPRINGADLYVARVTKVGMGSAKPCWRCLEWCRWAGVKRIFHWNAEDGKFDMVKVNTAERDQYETHADIRLYAGMVRRLVCVLAHIDPDMIYPFRAGNITGNTGLGDGSAVSHRSLLRPAVVNGGVTDRGYNNVGIDLRLLERTHTLIVACLRAILY